jgi:hypothetical protein
MAFSIPPLRNVEFRSSQLSLTLGGRYSKAPQNESVIATVRNPTATRTVQFDRQIRGLALQPHRSSIAKTRDL